MEQARGEGPIQAKPTTNCNPLTKTTKQSTEDTVEESIR